MTVKKSMSFSRKQVIEFIQLPDDKQMIIEVEGDEATANKLLQCMRMELSRMRMKVRQRGGVPQAFKLSFIDIQQHANNPHLQLLTIHKKAGDTELSQEMCDILDTIDLRGINK